MIYYWNPNRVVVQFIELGPIKKPYLFIKIKQEITRKLNFHQKEKTNNNLFCGCERNDRITVFILCDIVFNCAPIW